MTVGLFLTSGIMIFNDDLPLTLNIYALFVTDSSYLDYFELCYLSHVHTLSIDCLASIELFPVRYTPLLTLLLTCVI